MQLVKNSDKGDKELSDLHKGKKSTFRGWLKDFKKLEESRITYFMISVAVTKLWMMNYKLN